MTPDQAGKIIGWLHDLTVETPRSINRVGSIIYTLADTLHTEASRHSSTNPPWTGKPFCFRCQHQWPCPSLVRLLEPLADLAGAGG